MEKVIIYRAFDGTEFQYAGECEDYEENALKESVFLFDEKGKAMSMSEDNFKRSTFLQVLSTQGGRILEGVFPALAMPWEAGHPETGKWAFVGDKWIDCGNLENIVDRILYRVDWEVEE